MCYFFSGHRIISGMVIAPLSWCRGEWVDYTFAANLAPCVFNILQKKNLPWSPITDHEYHENIDGSLISVIICYIRTGKIFLLFFYITALDKGVVLVRCGINWGTGVLVHKNTGTFLTCSHVVAEVKFLKFEEYY